MAQIQDGSVAVVNGSNTVDADPAVDWSQADAALAGGMPVLFSVIGDIEIPYQMTDISYIVTGTPHWRGTLISNYQGDTNAAAAYIIHTDFSIRWDLPLPSPGDTQMAQIISRAFETIDTAIPSGGWDGIAKVSGADFTSTATALTNITGLLSSTLPINTLYEFQMALFCASSDASGLQLAIAASGALATFCIFSGTATGSTASAVVSIGANNKSVATATFLAVAGNGIACVRGFFKTSGSPGSQIVGQIAKVTAGTATVYVGSNLKWRQALP